MGYVKRQRVNLPLANYPAATVTERGQARFAVLDRRYRREHPDSETEGVVAFAEWTNRQRQPQFAPVVETPKGRMLRLESGGYAIHWRDGSGTARVERTKLRDRQNAIRRLAELEAEARNVRDGLRSPAQQTAADHARRPLCDHFKAYVEWMTGRGSTASHVKTTGHNLKRVADATGWATLADIDPEGLQRWLLEYAQSPSRPGAAARNAVLVSWKAFANWAMRTGRMLDHPLRSVAKAPSAGGERRQRRAMTEDECSRLLRAARLRPVAEHGRATVAKDAARIAADEAKASRDRRRRWRDLTTRSRRTWAKAPLCWETLEAAAERGRAKLAERNPALLDAAEAEGRGRELLYALLLTTGLRWGEARSLRVDSIDLDGVTAGDDPGWLDRLPQHATRPGQPIRPCPTVRLSGAAAKNGKDAVLPLRLDLAVELAAWFAERSARAARVLRPEAPLFDMPGSGLAVFRRDLAAASIERRDSRGEVVDVHALRTAFATGLARAGVPLRQAQELCRHSTPELTARVYQRLRVVDVLGAVESLPAPFGDRKAKGGQRAGDRPS